MNDYELELPPLPQAIELDTIGANLSDQGTDNLGMGPEYHRRKPYDVDYRNFRETVNIDYPTSKFAGMEDYLVEQASSRSKDPYRKFQDVFPDTHWDRKDDKIRFEDHVFKKETPDGAWVTNAPTGEYGHYSTTGMNSWDKRPTSRQWYPRAGIATHEFNHHLTTPKVGTPDYDYRESYTPFPGDKGKGSWAARPREIQAEAAKAKRDYIYNTVPSRMKKLGSGYGTHSHPWNDPELNPEGLSKDEFNNKSRELYKKSYEVEPFDKNHPAVKNNFPVPENILDSMFESWMEQTPYEWGDSYKNNPKEFPKEKFKEALRLGKKDQPPAGLFTGRGPLNA